MPVRFDRAPSEWFNEAARAYEEGHQGCAWCRGPHSVYRNQRGPCVEYLCSCCEFYAIHDQAANQFFAGPGQTQEDLVEPNLSKDS